jgi:hypothetical protein
MCYSRATCRNVQRKHKHNPLEQQSDPTMNIFDVLNEYGSELTEEQKRQIEAEVADMMRY